MSPLGWVLIALAVIVVVTIIVLILRSGDRRALGWLDGFTDALMLWWTFEWLSSIDFGGAFDLDLTWD